MRLPYTKKRMVFVFWALLFSFLLALPAILSVETCAPMPVDTISDLIAAEKIRLGQRMEGVPQLSVVRSGDAADEKKMYAVLNSFFAEPQKALPVRTHKQRVAAKLSDALREPSLDSLVEKEIAVLADAHGEDKTLLSLMDLFYLDKETKARNYFSPDKVRQAVETLRIPQEEKQKIVRVMSQLGEEIKKRKDAFQQAGLFDLEKMRTTHRETLSAVLSGEGISQSELLNMMGTVLARQSGEGSVTAVSGRNIESLLQFDEALDDIIAKSDIHKNVKVIGLLGDIEPALSVRMARKGPAPPIEMAYVSRSSMMSDGEKLAHYDALHQNPSLALDESLLDQGLVYNKIYRKNRDGTEAGIFVESRDEVRAAGHKIEEIEPKFRDDFKTRLEQLLDSDPEFAKESERIYSQLRLGDEDVVFIDTGFKGTIPTFLAAMHEIKHPNRQALTFLYGVKEDFAEVIPHFVIGRKPVKNIEYMGKFSDIGAFSPTDGALVGKTTPKEQLLASIDQFLIGKAERGHEPIPPQPLRPVPRDVEPLPIQPRPEAPASPVVPGPLKEPPPGWVEPGELPIEPLWRRPTEPVREIITPEKEIGVQRVIREQGGIVVQTKENLYFVPDEGIERGVFSVLGKNTERGFSLTPDARIESLDPGLTRQFRQIADEVSQGRVVPVELSEMEKWKANLIMVAQDRRVSLHTAHPIMDDSPLIHLYGSHAQYLSDYAQITEANPLLRRLHLRLREEAGAVMPLTDELIPIEFEEPDVLALIDFRIGGVPKYRLFANEQEVIDLARSQRFPARTFAEARESLRQWQIERIAGHETYHFAYDKLLTPPQRNRWVQHIVTTDDAAMQQLIFDLVRKRTVEKSEDIIDFFGGSFKPSRENYQTMLDMLTKEEIDDLADEAFAYRMHFHTFQEPELRTVGFEPSADELMVLREFGLLGETKVPEPKGKVVVTVQDMNIQALKQAYEQTGSIDERVRLAAIDIARTDLVTGEKVFEIKGRHVDTQGKTVGIGPGGISFDHFVGVLNDGTVDVSRNFFFHQGLDPDGSLVVRAIRTEDEQFSAALRSMGVETYVTEPVHNLELVTLCRLHPCTIEAPPDAVLDDIGQWLPTDEARAFFEGTVEGQQWVEQHRAGGVWAGIKRLFGRETIDLEKLTENALDYPDVFLRGRKYPITVDIQRAPVQEAGFDYDSLQVMNILDISPEVAKARGVSNVQKIGVAYQEEVGLLDAGQPTPQLSKLIDEGVLTPQELDQLRRGAPMAMGGRTEEDLRRAVGVSSLKITSVIDNDPGLVRLAKEAGRNDQVQDDIDHLIEELHKGNLQAGKGLKHIQGTDISYMRGNNGGRLFIRRTADGYEIVGKAAGTQKKGNEHKVIARLKELY